jgi:hypothetical protein
MSFKSNLWYYDKGYRKVSLMHNAPTFFPTADESKATIPIAAALQPEQHERELMLLLPNGQRQRIPTPLAGVLAIAAQAMMSGYAVSLTIHSGFLTTKQAADMLACSRQHVVKRKFLAVPTVAYALKT